jgi:tetratricopeptide (TPR) repeat protein
MKHTQQAEQRYQLAKAWHRRGSAEAALSAFGQVLELEPEHVGARTYLGYLLLKSGDLAGGLQALERVLELRPDASRVRSDVEFLRRLADPAAFEAGRHLPTINPAGKIQFRSQSRIEGHRSGWPYALAALEPLHNPAGVRFDGFLEDLFAWQHRSDDVRSPAQLLEMHRAGEFETEATSEEKGLTPFREPWVGFLHNPPGMPAWFHPAESIQRIFARRIWQESLPYCLGLLVLSDYMAGWLREQVDVPISVLRLPAETPDLRFDFDRFLENSAKKIVQVGWWLRRLNAIYELPVPDENAIGYQKVKLVPRFFADSDRYLKDLSRQERDQGQRRLVVGSTIEVQHIPDEQYDALLSENIVFIELYDASANNTVVECLVRGTPLLVNPLPAVVEYLGPDYPLYYQDLAQAAEWCLDMGRLRAAHDCLLANPLRGELSAAAFRDNFVNSAVYQSLPTP